MLFSLFWFNELNFATNLRGVVMGRQTNYSKFHEIDAIRWNLIYTKKKQDFLSINFMGTSTP